MRNGFLAVLALVAVVSVAVIAQSFLEPPQVWDVKKMHLEMHGEELSGEQAQEMIEMHEAMRANNDGMQEGNHQEMHGEGEASEMNGKMHREGGVNEMANEMMDGKMHGGKKKGGCH